MKSGGTEAHLWMNKLPSSAEEGREPLLSFVGESRRRMKAEAGVVLANKLKFDQHHPGLAFKGGFAAFY